MQKQLPDFAAMLKLILGCLLAGGVLAASGCAGRAGARSDKILVTRGAYKLVEHNGQATAVFAEKASQAPGAELICERVLLGKQLRTLCYARTEEADRVRDHKEKWLELTTLPGAGG